MDFEKISSRSNEKVKLFRHLSQSASFRRETGLFALEGARLCSDVAKTGIEIKTAFFTKEALEKYPDYISAVAEKAEQAFEIPHELAGTLSDTREAQGVFCICVKRKEAELETIDPKGDIYSARQYAGSVESRRGAQNRGGVRHERRHSRRRVRYI